eukprot:CAMPEP_0114625260 /NCGR_PEP_ID=MMETSP0168-20121206/11180_1 /TAXON_ID=95228 ORGANISM="Vannella sp., Strain DIVA3 517/6/12" /NCGR_SAMPLE_ID=MMETSP0168 /ASSEMBLY_ACC=CAM_ASM_000044 /LENGTH=480 /DNA_ID=CAMNT_0001836539 /DNA_START=136 /DNA_END=1575 /DNA_ORIENTATION=+
MNEKKDFEATKAEIANVTKQASAKAVKGLKSALAIGAYQSETDDEIGRSKAHAKHMRKTRKRNFARKMHLIDPNYGKKAAGILAAGTALGLAATTVPGVGSVLGPTMGGAVIAGGLAYLETDAHRSLGDHAILDSLLDDRGDNWRTNTGTTGFKGKGDYEAESALSGVVDSDDEDFDFDDLLPPEYGGKAAILSSSAGAAGQQQTKSNSLPGLIGGLDISEGVHDDDEDDDIDGLMDLGSFAPKSKKAEPQETGRSYTLDQPYSQQQSQGVGQRFTNPHSSPAVQMAGQGGNTTPAAFFDLVNGPPAAAAAPPTAAQPAADPLVSMAAPITATPVIPAEALDPSIPPHLQQKLLQAAQLKAQQAQARPLQMQPQDLELPPIMRKTPKPAEPEDPFALLAKQQLQSQAGGDAAESAKAAESAESAPASAKSGSIFATAAAQIPSAASSKAAAAPAEDDPFAELYNRPQQSAVVAASYDALH